MPTNAPEQQPEDGRASEPRDDQLPTDASHANPIDRIPIWMSAYIARHPTLLRVLEWLGWNNPGGSMNP